MSYETYRVTDLIDEIAMGPFGSNIKVSCFVDSGVPVLNGSNLEGFSLSEKAFRFVTKEKADSLNKANAHRGDIVITHRGTLGQIVFIPQDSRYDRYVISQSQFRVRCNDKVLPEYLVYYFHTPIGQHKLLSNASQVGVPALARPSSTFQQIEVELPELSIQKRVVEIITTIQKKIENNQELNDNLEQQLMLLYDYWFIQFDFPDNNGNPYQISGGKMVWNDTLRRNIPENWKVQSVISNCLSSVIKPGVKIFNTKTYLATADVKGTSISTGTIVDYDGRESRANMQPSINSVWFAKMKNSIKHLYLNKEMQPIISSSILSTGFCGLQCNEISFEYIASYVSNAYFEIHKDMLAHGATQEAVNNDDLAGVHIIIPEDTVLCAYHETTQAIYAQISKNVCENQELVKLRDWLLPMLMNGQATIND